MIRLDFTGCSGSRSQQPVSWEPCVQQFEDSGPASFLEDTAGSELSPVRLLVSRRQQATDDNRDPWAAAAHSPEADDIDPGDEDDDEDDFDEDDELANDDEAEEDDADDEEDDEDVDEDDDEDDEDDEDEENADET